MIKINRFFLLTFLMVSVGIIKTSGQQNIDLSGEWTVAIDSLDSGIREQWQNKRFADKLTLPGTLDDARLGKPNTLEARMEKKQLTHLTRKYRYVGAAWYAKEVHLPKAWKGQNTILKLERVIWKTSVWVDDRKVDTEQNSLIAPHYFDLTPYLVPGKTHKITLRIDNRKLFDLSYEDMAHAYTDHTQIIWNGVIGEISLQARPQVRIEHVQLYPDSKAKLVKVVAMVNNDSKKQQKASIAGSFSPQGENELKGNAIKELTLVAGVQEVEFHIPVNGEVKEWDEFNPHMYTANLVLEVKGSRSEQKADFGFRDFKRSGKEFHLNGVPVFFRGTLECNIFPLTGYPPTQTEHWKRIFQTAKNWGINHIRFHSWCPPEAAFAAADEIGMYLQVELPIWSLTVGELQSTTEFLYSEAGRIIQEYGNHPSFLLMSIGNELQGKMVVLNKLTDELKRNDSRRLYTNTSFTFEKGHGDRPEANDDFFVTQWTKDGWVRGQGVFNDYSPSFSKNYQTAVSNLSIPVITHEIGQYAVYPNMKEIEKYTGVLDPLNFKAIRQDLEKKGMLAQADQFLKSSGKLAAILYKEEIERALKTKGISGFQLLDLHDFPGQGTALVGLLDAFWDSKGIVEADYFSRFNATVVPLLNFEKATYSSSESFEAEILLSNYSGKVLNGQAIEWSIVSGDKKLAGSRLSGDLNVGLNEKLGKIAFPLNGITQATRLTVTVKLPDTRFENSWDIWVYPSENKVDFGEVFYTRDVNEAEAELRKGRKVLLNPDWKTIEGLEGKFVPVFWSPVHFPKQAGTMGLLLEKQHPAFKQFPTEGHTDWQWWDLHRNSTTMRVDSLQGGRNVIQMIDNFANNRKLSLAFEGSVGNGKLMVVSIDLSSEPEKRIVAKQLLISVLAYMNSKDFAPAEIRNPEWLKQKLAPKQQQQEKKDAKALY